MYKKRKCYLVLVIIILLCCFVFEVCKYKEEKTESNESFYVSYYRIKEVLENNVSDRVILTFNDTIFVGNGKKELENGYYDLKICKDNKYLEIYINKLWKAFDEKLYQEEYINQLVLSLLDIYELNKNKYKNLLYDYIVEGYLFSKQIKGVKIESDDKLKIEEVNIERKIIDNQLILIVSKEVGV